MLFRVLLALLLAGFVAAEPNCTWALPANLTACPTVCTPRCSLNETVTCVNSTCDDHPSCSLNCTGVVYSNVSCPTCSAHCYTLDCPVDCTINSGLECAWDCVPMSNCPVPLPELVCESYGCEYAAAGRVSLALFLTMLIA